MTSLNLPPEFGGPPEFTTTARVIFEEAKRIRETIARDIEIGGIAVDWFSSAISLLGDIVDPFLPGFAGSENRATSSTTNLSGINRARAAAGLPPLGGRRRRRKALTQSDKADIAFISGTLGKPAGRDFAMIVAART